MYNNAMGEYVWVLIMPNAIMLPVKSGLHYFKYIYPVTECKHICLK